MELIEIISAVWDDPEHVAALMIVHADVGAGPDIFPFAYVPTDPYGLTPYVTAWLAAHPEFVIQPYVEPESEEPKD